MAIFRQISAADIENLAAPAFKATWLDVDGVAPNSLRLRDRVFIGAAVDTNDRRITGGVQPSWGSYANWAPRDSDMVVMSARGMLAFTAMSRTSDKAGVSPAPSTWGLGGFVINDAAGAFGRAAYLEAQRESGAGGTPGLEIVVKNKGDNQTSSSYNNNGGGADGVWLVAGGDASYGGSPANPATTGVHFKPGTITGAAYCWNKGIIFDANSITGTDGTDGDSGTGVAIEFSKQHQIQWLRPNGTVGAFIKSNVTNAGAGGGIRFDPTGVLITDPNGVIGASFQPVASGVNFLAFLGSATTAAVIMQASGSDTDVPINITPKGAGLLRATGLLMRQGVGTSRLPVANGDLTLEFTGNTTVTVRGRGSDGTTRTATITLA